MVSMNKLCKLLTDKYRVDFVVVDQEFHILSLSDGISRYIDNSIVIGDDIREFFYELIGYEKEIDNIYKKIKNNFEIKSIYKKNYYIDISIESFEDNKLVIFINDVTKDMEENRFILQDRNDNHLLNRILKDEIKKEVQKSRERDKHMLQQSKMAQMGEMIGAIAHQWRQPLSAVSLSIQGLKYSYKEGRLEEEEYIKEFIEKNKKTIKFMSNTIDDFRNFFRIDKEKMEFNVAKATKSVVNMLLAQLEDYSIEIDITYDDFEILGYESEYQQVLLNIINNSKDALIDNKIENPKIIIFVKIDKITIEDNAGGIPEEILDRIFEPYFTTKECNKGTGMGLYMSKMIIEDNMGGTLRAENTKHGVVFSIIL